MKQLLDTHSFIWFVMGSSKISDRVRIQIENNENLISAASIWEMAIKYNSGKLSLGLPFEIFLEQQIKPNGIELLNITIEHLTIISKLPLHHRDPFDRLLIAQAIVEQLPIIGADKAFDAYPIQRLWF